MRLPRLSIVNPRKAWILVDQNNPLLEMQCLAVAELMDFPAHLHRVSMPWFWRYMPLGLGVDVTVRAHSTPKPLMTPWPSFVLCSGSVALKIGTYLRKKHHTFTVALGTSSSSFHKVVLEGHQQDEKSNKIITLGPLHRIHADVLLQARKTFYRKIDHLPKPRVGLFLEGEEPLEPLREELICLYKKTPFSLMIHGGMLSEKNKKYLTAFPQEIPQLFWHGQENDPYLGFLAHSDAIIVSNSSSLKVAQASSAGTSLFIYPSRPLNAYVQTLIQKGYASLLTRDSFLFSRSRLPPLQEAKRVASLLKEAYTASYGVSP